VAAQGFEAAYDRYAPQRIRVHHQRAMPLLSLHELRQSISAHPRKAKLEVSKIDAASLGDLGYSYGDYEVTTGEGSKDGWRIVLEVNNPLPAVKN
jgi:hypothetical protein